MRVFVLVLAVLLTFGCQQKDDSSQTSQTKKPSASQTLRVVTEQTGKFVINPQFDSANDFREGLAEVRIGDDKTGKWGYIDKQGKMVINPQFDCDFSCGVFSEGLAAVRIGDDKTGKWGYISR